MTAFTFDCNETILLTATGILFLVQIAFYTIYYLRIPRHKKAAGREATPYSTDCPPLSVVIYARESCEQLQANLPAVLEQDYPQYEVIVITDGTDDGTSDYLTQLQIAHPHLYHSFIPNSSRYISHKKLALTLGIKAAHYDWLVMTETDCRPATNQWLRLLARNFTSGTEIVLGYNNYQRSKGWFHKCIAYDNLFQAMRYLGAALGGHPYMGLGRNLAYRKELFYKTKGFSNHLNLLRGDDDLFVNQIATGRNTRVETDAHAVMQRRPYARTKDWREEKIGYASTARLYKGMQRYVSGLETTTRLLFHTGWIGTAMLAVNLQHWLVAGMALLLFLFRWGVQAYAINKNARTLGDPQRYYLTLPLLDIIQPIQSLRWKLYCLFRRKSEFLRK